jgi:hypothetical protein
MIDASSFGVNQETALVFKLGPDGARHKNALLRDGTIFVCAMPADSKLYIIGITRTRPVFEQQTQNNNWELIEKLVSIPRRKV